MVWFLCDASDSDVLTDLRNQQRPHTHTPTCSNSCSDMGPRLALVYAHGRTQCCTHCRLALLEHLPRTQHSYDDDVPTITCMTYTVPRLFLISCTHRTHTQHPACTVGTDTCKTYECKGGSCTVTGDVTDGKSCVVPANKCYNSTVGGNGAGQCVAGICTPQLNVCVREHTRCREPQCGPMTACGCFRKETT